MVDASDLKRAYVRGAFRGLIAASEDLLARAVADTPVDEGTLRESALITYIVNGRRYQGAAASAAALAYALTLVDGPLSVKGEVSFNTEYARAQHEGIAFMIRGQTGYVWQAQNYPGGGGPKFLERNVIAHGERYQKVIAASAEKSIKEAGES